MHAAEAETLPARIVAAAGQPGSDPDWLRGHGVPEEDVPVLVMDPAQRSTGVLAMPEPDRFVADGERLPSQAGRYGRSGRPGTPRAICACTTPRRGCC